MNKDNLNISKIETYLNSVIDGVVSDNTFFTTIPDASVVQSNNWQDMVLINIPSGMRDMNAMGVGTIFIGLYARPMSSGRKNVAMMSQLETRLNEAIANAKDPNYRLERENVYSTYDDDIKWHCNVVELILKIF